MAGAIVVAVAAMIGCGSRTALGTGGASTKEIDFPVGIYAHCTDGLYTGDGNVFLRSTGTAVDGTLTVTRNGGQTGTVSAVYVDVASRATTQTFAIVTETAATLAPPGQTMDGFTGFCVQGIGFNHESPFAATMAEDGGTLTYSHGAMIMTASGEVSGDGGPCGPQKTSATRWIVCDQSPPVAFSADAIDATFASTGTFTCVSQIGTDFPVGSNHQYVGAGGEGTLVVAPSGDRVVATYSGDATMSGAFRFDGATSAIANLDAAESVTARCDVPIATTGVNPASGALDVGSASLVREGSTLLLVYSGKMNATTSCAGAHKAGALVCSPK